ncbi:(2Fe-2S)-binding protein [Falsiroseomonas oryzae]|uniref:(2Fe-2S)-binding protein n=1 Tax=Falsiroseomonas oryzae TaxID=2766473 RepID=UPI0022EAC360|nr:(2Fe-2S)-binding protein [Roseomonas sp. MO-31]
MYLCLCNGLSDTRIADAIRQGARRPRDVYALCGCRAQCGRCMASILGVLRSAAPPLSAKQDR